MMANLTRKLLFIDIAFSYNLSRSLLVRVFNNDRYHLRFSRSYCMDSTQEAKKETVISEAMKAHMKRCQEYEIFIQQQVEEYQRGKQFLAKIMGMNFETMTEDDINSAIQYLFPSGLFNIGARPMMKDPIKLFKKQKEAQMDNTGRPFNYLFYTTKPTYSELMHKCAELLEELNEKCRNLTDAPPNKTVTMINSRWISKEKLEMKLDEKLLDVEYDKFVESLELMLTHPFGYEASEIINEYSQFAVEKKFELKLPTTVEKNDGVTSVFVERCKKKQCFGSVKLVHPGVGKITINDKEFISFFPEFRTRMQVLSPLVLTNMLGKVDIIGNVDISGATCQAMVIRSGISFGLLPLISDELKKRLKMAGYLERDPRIRERKKPGQKGARAKYTWLKR